MSSLYSNRLVLVAVFTLCWLSCTYDAAPVQSTLQAMSYLTKFGYIESSSSSSRHSSLLTEDALVSAIKEFQRFAGLNQTGTIDNETSVMMNTPRCGVKDKVGHGNNARRKRYALQGSRWRVKDLTYKISKYPAGRLTKMDVDEEFRRSFQTWTEYTNLKFTQKTSGTAHIDIRFEKGEHGDGDPFDGSGGTLAHAYFPIYGGDAHFDDAETWTIKSYRGTNLFQTATHEIGHSLGLSHSDAKGSLMAPFYQSYDPDFVLHKDDIQAIQALYGTKSKGRPMPVPPTSSSYVPPRDDGGGHEEGELCSDSAIDTIFQVDKKTYAFKGEYYWLLTDVGLADGYPRAISKDWKNLPSNIDAAFSWRNGKTYFFKGDRYWRYTGKEMDPDYPQKIVDGFPGIPSNMDAAFVWSGNGKIYFFKGMNYWRFDPEQLPPVSADYPKTISNWEGIPDNINAAFQWTNGYTYFFKGTYYWRFNDRTFAVDKARPPFPRPSGIWWFGCKSMTADDDPHPGVAVVPSGNVGPSDLVGPSSTHRYDHADMISTDRQHSEEHMYAKDEVELYQPDANGDNMDAPLMSNGVTGQLMTRWTSSWTLLTSLVVIACNRLLIARE